MFDFVIIGLDPSICYCLWNNKMLGSSPSMMQRFKDVGRNFTKVSGCLSERIGRLKECLSEKNITSSMTMVGYFRRHQHIKRLQSSRPNYF